jgi:hypothetical protein
MTTDDRKDALREQIADRVRDLARHARVSQLGRQGREQSGNDADRLADDPIHKLLLDRDPIEGARLGSQRTISRRRALRWRR